MNPAEQLAALGVEDVQATRDERGVLIDEVGIDGLSYPIAVEGRDGDRQQTAAEVSMAVELAHDSRGVHMSRFVEVLDAHAAGMGPDGFREMVKATRYRLGSDFARVKLGFPYFLRRRAPTSEMPSMVRYECTLTGESRGEEIATEVGVRVAVTSLCPCSKEISDYGAHNQRGYVEISATSPWSGGEASGIWFEDLVDVAEAAASAPIYPLLKRSDERTVTMQAYDKPAFVEDIVRDIVVALRTDVRVAKARVRASNQESIHDHNAVAQLQWERR
ncbi:MAG: cyclohydrolase [Solirubrobacterales bacterium]|jgi:GTP cyclohydrolase FolE2|nr:cyclohydrolase [Solirubrobacterales bacterium]